MCSKKIASTNHYSESYEDSYSNIDDELDKTSKDHTHYSLSNPIPIYYHNTDLKVLRIMSKRIK